MDQFTVGGVSLDSMCFPIRNPDGVGQVDADRPLPERQESDEPPVGAVVIDGEHVWMHREDGWTGCLTCGDEDLGWSWDEVRADVGQAYRVVEP